MQKRIYAIKENALKQYKIIPEHAKSINLLLSSFIQTILSALELHQIMPFGSWAVPPVELHPALKIVIQLRTIIIFDIISVNKSFLLLIQNTIICKQVNTGYFLISFCLGNFVFPTRRNFIISTY